VKKKREIEPSKRGGEGKKGRGEGKGISLSMLGSDRKGGKRLPRESRRGKKEKERISKAGIPLRLECQWLWKGKNRKSGVSLKRGKGKKRKHPLSDTSTVPRQWGGGGRKGQGKRVCPSGGRGRKKRRKGKRLPTNQDVFLLFSRERCREGEKDGEGDIIPEAKEKGKKKKKNGKKKDSD